MVKKLVSIIIPCYNEEEGLPYLASKLRPIIKKLEKDYNTEILFVDDGSTDNTNKILHEFYKKEKKVKILKHEKNRNLGAALRTGFKHSKGEIVVALDSDCTYDPKIIFKLLEKIKENDIVTVSPYHPLGKVKNVPKYRLFLSNSVSIIYRLLLGTKLYTYTAMVRAYKKEVIKNINFKSNTFLGVTEIMIKAILAGYKVDEIPAQLNVRKYGVSKIKTFKVILDHLKLIFKIILNKFANVKI